MFKNMKLSMKMAAGFGALIIICALLGLISYNGLSKLNEKTELAEAGNEIKFGLDNCAMLRKDFLINGFVKLANEDLNAAEKWQTQFHQLKEQLEELSQNSNLEPENRTIVAETSKAMEDYKDSFEHQKLARSLKDEAFENWKEVGWDITEQINTLQNDTIQPAVESARASEDINKINYWSNIEAGLGENVIQEFLLLRVTAVYLLATSKEQQWIGYQDQLKNTFDGLDEWQNSVKDNSELTNVADKIRSYLNDYAKAGKKYHQGMVEQIEADKEMAAVAKVLIGNIESLHSSLIDQMNSLRATTNAVMITMSITAIVVGTVLAIVITISIIKPINRIIAGLTEGTEQVASASGQVSAASQSLAEGATEQAAGLEETSSSLEEMSSMTKQNADNAQQANTLSAEAKKAADNGSESMKRMNSAIQDIQKSSDETAKIIKVIDEIAFQTNLLALNAAVEAARAGEAGKGFAVVAEEVRNLAMRSAEAAKNTSNLIEESVKNSKNGVDIAGEVGKALEEIVSGVSKASELVSEIAAASSEQAQGIEQVNTAVTQMDKVTQQNAANAEESASASEELSAQAEQMNSIVNELVNLVGGSAKVNNVKTSKKSTRMKTSDHVFHHIADGNSKQHDTKPQKAAKKVEHAIPLDDNDFDDFNG